MWLLYFVTAFQASISYNLVPFATSSFKDHSLLTVIYIVSNAMSAALYIPLAKVLDLWGRAEGFLLMVSFATLGLILTAMGNGLSTFCAAQVFYSIGIGGVIYSINVITADASKLKNRGLAFAFTSSPNIITAFAGPKAAEDFYYHVSWRWGFGCFAIISPFVAAPLYLVLKANLRRARKQGLLMREGSGRTLPQTFWHYILEFDGKWKDTSPRPPLYLLFSLAAGVFLFAFGLTVFLLPFNLAETAPKGWGTGYIIAMIVVGLVVLVAFGLYETFLAPTPFLSAKVLANRTVIGTCLLSFTVQISYFCWASYFTSFLQVVNNLSLAEAGYVTETFDVVSGFLLLFVGILIRKTGYYRWLLFVAVPLYIFGQGLMIHFRQPNSEIGFIVMCQIFVSIGGAIFIIVQQISILAAADHQHVAAVLALLYVVDNVGGAVGNTISGTIWTNTFYKALKRYLPDVSRTELQAIYDGLDVQLSYAVGTTERLGIQQAYAYAQTRMLAVGTVIMGLSLIWMLVIKNINVSQIQQVRGTVF